MMGGWLADGSIKKKELYCYCYCCMCCLAFAFSLLCSKYSDGGGGICSTRLLQESLVTSIYLRTRMSMSN